MDRGLTRSKHSSVVKEPPPPEPEPEPVPEPPKPSWTRQGNTWVAGNPDQDKAWTVPAERSSAGSVRRQGPQTPKVMHKACSWQLVTPSESAREVAVGRSPSIGSSSDVGVTRHLGNSTKQPSERGSEVAPSYAESVYSMASSQSRCDSMSQSKDESIAGSNATGSYAAGSNAAGSNAAGSITAGLRVAITQGDLHEPLRKPCYPYDAEAGRFEGWETFPEAEHIYRTSLRKPCSPLEIKSPSGAPELGKAPSAEEYPRPTAPPSPPPPEPYNVPDARYHDQLESRKVGTRPRPYMYPPPHAVYAGMPPPY